MQANKSSDWSRGSFTSLDSLGNSSPINSGNHHGFRASTSRQHMICSHRMTLKEAISLQHSHAAKTLQQFRTVASILLKAQVHAANKSSDWSRGSFTSLDALGNSSPINSGNHHGFIASTSRQHMICSHYSELLPAFS